LLQQQKLQESGSGQDEAEDDDKEVEGYIWESMQRNAQRMLQLKTEKGIVDPMELERELLRNFQTNDLSAQRTEVRVDQHDLSQINQDDQKFTSSYILDAPHQHVVDAEN